ncbi:hypothetical protein [Ruminococcus flavefaciens]|uniref:hypothetical protein n=1 Tax=Ruminococcus flavefaciens TaxID=1265 RepID=UPI0026EA3D75|nr:hypothetical protein [Ruminococcus flavefaciens]
MKLYRSLIYRELMLTRKRFILMLILFLLLALLMMTPLILVFIFKPVEGEESPLEMIPLFVGIVALTGGFMAGTNNGLQKADISSGWKRYSFVLPPTAKQQALSDLLTKLCYILFFGLLSVAFLMVCKIVSGINTAVEGIDPICRMLNIYLGAVCAVMLVDIAYSYIMMFANDKNQLKLISALAFVGAGAVLKVFGLFPRMNKTEKPAEDGTMISEEAINKFETFLSSGKTTLCILAVFVVLCVLFFLAMWRSHERRES